ncbi:alkaline phosphatase family protein [bacterium]|nr:alkaline phosphatase family protein [bacterium]
MILRKISLIGLVALGLMSTSVFSTVARFPSQSQTISKIAFGSCLKQGNDLSIFNSIIDKHPDLFVFGGDNVYADTTDESRLKSIYNTLGESKEYKAFTATVPVVATWDDHDYGINDAGAEHPEKVMSQRVFLDFFGEPKNSVRRRTGGVYTSYQFGPWNKRVNLIILDTRFFRSKLVRKKGSDGKKHYLKNKTSDATILGAKQWAWLEKEIKEPATLTIIVSSIQILSNEHRFEKWGNYPYERERLLNLVKKSSLENVVFISGDRHFSEISKASLGPGKNLYEITSSGMNHGGRFGKHENNPYRTAWIGENGFSLLDIDWQKTGPKIKVNFYDVAGNIHTSKMLDL